MRPEPDKTKTHRVILALLVVITLTIPMHNTPNNTNEKPESHRQNRLANEKSPYLLQHAENPVNWYPWSDEAFETAKRENKPVFLSIGYSTCHWCHVMAHESFEDPEVAALMNEAFINIKVDREERPDIDNVYMKVCQMLTNSGGWPLTIIMTPDKRPFFAGTYIPKTTRYGRMGMTELIPKVQKVWQESPDEIEKSAASIVTALNQSQSHSPGIELNLQHLENAAGHFKQIYDSTNGGFGDAPKFPTPHNLLFLLRQYHRTGDPKLLDIVETTLTKMHQGGIYDHLGYGFHRYSTDSYWLVPHFEKMLYDQALISLTYLELYQVTGKEHYADIAREIFTYVLRDLTDPAGGFYCAEDADSEGEEGKFFFWTEAEIFDALPQELAELVIDVYNCHPKGNFNDESSGKRSGHNILHLANSIADAGKKLKIPLDELQGKLTEARKILFELREKRIHPHKDDKILTDWNGLMIAALARGSVVLDKPEYYTAAANAANFIKSKLTKADGLLLHRYREGQAAYDGSLDDYAFLSWGLLELYQAGFNVDHLKDAIATNKTMLAKFWDKQNDGFYFTADNSEQLITRTKDLYDGAIPSGNSVAFMNLLTLSRITADTSYDDYAGKVHNAFSGEIVKAPAAYSFFMCAVDFGIGPSTELVLAGDPKTAKAKAIWKTINSIYLPRKVIVSRPDDTSEIETIAPYTKYQKGSPEGPLLYICENFQCKEPISDPVKIQTTLSQ